MIKIVNTIPTILHLILSLSTPQKILSLLCGFTFTIVSNNWTHNAAYYEHSTKFPPPITTLLPLKVPSYLVAIVYFHEFLESGIKTLRMCMYAHPSSFRFEVEIKMKINDRK